MKRKIAMVLCVLIAISLAGCSSPGAQTPQETQSTTQAATETQEQTNAETTAIPTEAETVAETTEESNSVTITIPSGVISDPASIDDSKVISKTVNEDGSITVEMNGAQRDQILQSTAESADKAIKAIVDEKKYENVVDIKRNDDFTEFTVVSSDPEAFQKAIGIALLTAELKIYASMYQSFNGVQDKSLDVSYVDETGAEFLHKHYPETE